MLSVLRTQVQSLVRELKSYVPRGVAKKKNKKELAQVMPIKSNQTPGGMGGSMEFASRRSSGQSRVCCLSVPTWRL